MAKPAPYAGAGYVLAALLLLTLIAALGGCAAGRVAADCLRDPRCDVR